MEGRRQAASRIPFHCIRATALTEALAPGKSPSVPLYKRVMSIVSQ